MAAEARFFMYLISPLTGFGMWGYCLLKELYSVPWPLAFSVVEYWKNIFSVHKKVREQTDVV